MFRTDVVEKIKTHIFISGTYFFFSLENLVIYETMCNKNVQPGGPQMIYT